MKLTFQPTEPDQGDAPGFTVLSGEIVLGHIYDGQNGQTFWPNGKRRHISVQALAEIVDFVKDLNASSPQLTFNMIGEFNGDPSAFEIRRKSDDKLIGHIDLRGMNPHWFFWPRTSDDGGVYEDYLVEIAEKVRSLRQATTERLEAEREASLHRFDASLQTGRLSCSEPNEANVPKPGPDDNHFFEIYESLILTGQIRSEDVPLFVQQHPNFALWYERKHRTSGIGCSPFIKTDQKPA